MTGDAEAQAFARFRQEAECDEHVGLFERIEDFVQARREMRGVVAGGEQHARGAFHHAHDDAGRDAVSGNVGDVGDPVVGIAGKIDQVAADFAAGRGAAVEFPGAEFCFDGRDENAVDFGGEFDFGLHAEVAAAFLDIHDQEADVAEDRRDDDGPTIDGESVFAEPRSPRHPSASGVGKVVKILADQIADEELRGEDREERDPESAAQCEPGDGVDDGCAAGK